ncbi:hypothetical protein ABH927_004612 [Planotetraspora sp. GP83]
MAHDHPAVRPYPAREKATVNMPPRLGGEIFRSLLERSARPGPNPGHGRRLALPYEIVGAEISGMEVRTIATYLDRSYAESVTSLTPYAGDDPAQRASDADRDRVAAILGEALATGRLTSTEHADRLDAAYAAVTMGDLVPLTRDLPQVSGPTSLPATEKQEVAAVFSKVIRGGRWVAGRHTELRSTFGALIVDLTDAVIPGREVTLELNSFCGKLIVTVPHNAHVIDEGIALFSKRAVTGGKTEGDGPLIRVTGKAAFGKIVVYREAYP